jgi:very-short-patch-repair endonuclease
MTRRDDAPLLALTARQYGLVSWRQARESGFTPSALHHRLDVGRLEWVTRQVLGLVGRSADRRAPLMAGTLDAGRGTVVSRRAAAALWGLPGYRHGPVELARQKNLRCPRSSAGRIFTVRYLPEHLTAVVAGIPVVSLPYLLFQLAGFEHPARVERLLDSVITRSPGILVRLHELLPELAERGRNGIVLMRELLAERPPGTRVVASGLEARFERILRDAGERPLERQVDVGGHKWIGRVDFADRALGALFEVDSVTHHASVLDAANDAARDAALLAAGWRAVQRIPEEWIWHEPWRALAAVRRTRTLLGARSHALA